MYKKEENGGLADFVCGFEKRNAVEYKMFRACLLVSLVLWILCPIRVNAAQIDFQTKVTELKAQFPDGKYWNHVGMSTDNPDGYTSTPCSLHKTNNVDHVYGTNGCTCNHFVGGGHLSSTQCMGFANRLAYGVFGDTTWTTVANPTTAQIADIKVGDIVRYSCAKEYTTGHSVFVIGKTGNKITIGEANFGGACKIGWDRVIDLGSSDYTVLYYEHAANYDSAVGAGGGNAGAGGSTETTEQPTIENPTTEQPTTEQKTPFTGWKKTVDGKHYQYYKKDKLQKKKWLTISKKKYYVDSKGYRVTGLVKIKNDHYYFDSKGVLQKKKWVTFERGNYYVGNTGCVLKSQWLYKGNTLVYVKKDGAVAKGEIVKIGSKKYYFNSKGKRSKGFKKVGKKYYYCNSSGVIQKKKWITEKKKTYYVDKNGIRSEDKLVKIGKYKYYFNAKGYLVKNKRFTYQDKIYKADKKGRCELVGVKKKKPEHETMEDDQISM
ncbi:MAG: hypothetical protein K2L07_02625 [Lachnospiraceae bacterium]|nr:hypothetical protein [Lachnospiraceae bacterium]